MQSVCSSSERAEDLHNKALQACPGLALWVLSINILTANMMKPSPVRYRDAYLGNNTSRKDSIGCQKIRETLQSSQPYGRRVDGEFLTAQKLADGQCRSELQAIFNPAKTKHPCGRIDSERSVTTKRIHIAAQIHKLQNSFHDGAVT